jgi:hypothetical protein
MPTLMDEFNSHMNGLCSQGEQNCVILSGVLQEKWLSDDFVDFGHFSRSGGLKFAEIIAQYIRSEFDSETYEGGTQRIRLDCVRNEPQSEPFVGRAR